MLYAIVLLGTVYYDNNYILFLFYSTMVLYASMWIGCEIHSGFPISGLAYFSFMGGLYLICGSWLITAPWSC